MTGEFSFYMLQSWPNQLCPCVTISTQLQMSTKIPSNLSDTTMEMHFTCINYATLYIIWLHGNVGYYLPRIQYILHYSRHLKISWLAQGRSASKWHSGDFSKSRSWDSKSHVHSTSQQYPLQDHSCISIPEEAGQPTNLRPVKLRCPELHLLATPLRPEQPKSQETTTCWNHFQIKRKAYWWHIVGQHNWVS